MGGIPKGLLPAPDSGEPLVVRLRRQAESLGLRCVLVGAAKAYAGLGMPLLVDDPPGIGPLGGLRALLAAAESAPVLALACDLPFVSRELLAQLLTPGDEERDGSSSAGIDVVAARRQDLWEPLCARYNSSVLPVLNAALSEGVRSFQGLLRRLRVHELQLLPGQQFELGDWDSPEDMKPRST